MRPECSALLLGDHATAASPSVSSPVRRGCTGRCIGVGGAGSSGAATREHADGTADGPEAADGQAGSPAPAGNSAQWKPTHWASQCTRGVRWLDKLLAVDVVITP